jgi:peroxiredoxin Q/BCP
LRFGEFAMTIRPVNKLLTLGPFAFVSAMACATPTSTATAPPASATSATSIQTAATSTPPPEGADDLVGKPAPDFTATAQDGTPVHLAALKGKRVVLYFYPKDETPGCTKEACSFRDAWQDLSNAGAVLVGISADTTGSHKDFAAHYKLPFLLVSDPDGRIGGTYGVPFEGHHQRQTFIVGADGNVLKVYRKVDVSVHAKQVLDDLTHAS